MPVVWGSVLAVVVILTLDFLNVTYGWLPDPEDAQGEDACDCDCGDACELRENEEYDEYPVSETNYNLG